MKRLVYVSGLSYSGSTLLGLMLSGNPDLIGMGEVYRLFTRAKNFLYHPKEVICSCGKPMDVCEFWAPTSDILRSALVRKEGEDELYRMFLDAYYEYFGPDSIPVDISKRDEGLGVLESLKGVEVHVIFLIRDVRSWTISMLEKARRAGDYYMADLIGKYHWKALKPFANRLSSRLFWKWYILNRRTQEVLRRSGFPVLQVGYEEICLYPEFMMRKICDFLELDYKASMLSLVDTQSHIIVGNRMRTQLEKRQRVAYDDRWFYKAEWMLPAVLFPQITRYNTREVFSNVKDNMWNS